MAASAYAAWFEVWALHPGLPRLRSLMAPDGEANALPNAVLEHLGDRPTYEHRTPDGQPTVAYEEGRYRLTLFDDNLADLDALWTVVKGVLPVLALDGRVTGAVTAALRREVSTVSAVVGYRTAAGLQQVFMTESEWVITVDYV